MINLKQIKLMGFKSFPDKTTITMTEGVTCIVGPNGCGKSNVADAIRWVFGEQSAKTMRGSQMADVIFNGTEKRRRQSLCEVTLVFDNSRHIFEVDADEVEMTRRLYRDGESEYLLNKQPSRMKTLTTLLHRAGAAKEGYSIIGQGRIAQIMDSKPEDRRSIFEEATGIVVFKDRKQEAENKLALSKENLREFQIGLDEVERHLVPLSRQAETAKKYSEIHSQLRYHEINTFIYRTESASEVRSTLLAEADEVRGQKDALKTRMDEVAAQELTIKDEIDAADEKLRELNDKRLEYSVGAERTNSQSKIFLERANSVKNRLNAVRDDITAYTTQIAGIDKNIKMERSYIEKNTGLLAGSREKAEKLRGEIDSLNATLSEHEYETGKNRDRVVKTLTELNELRENKGSLEAQKNLLEERVAEMEKERGKIAADRDAAQTEYDGLIQKQTEISSFVEKEDELIEEAAAGVRAADDKVAQFNEENIEAQSKLNTLMSRRDMVKSLREQFEGYPEAVKNLLGAAKEDSAVKKRITALIADVVTCDKDVEVAINTAFGQSIRYVITETRDDTRYLIDYLRNNRLGRVTFLPIEALRPRYENEQIRLARKEKGVVGFAIDLVKYDKKYENIIHFLLGNTLVCDNLVSATIISRAYPRSFKIVTLEGDLIESSGAMTGGSRRENTTNLLANERMLKDMDKEIGSLEGTLGKSRERKAVLETARTKAQANLDNVRRKISDARVELSSVTERQNALMKRINDDETSCRGYDFSIEQLRERLEQLGSRYSDIAEGASKLNQESATATEAITDISGKYEKLSRDRDAKVEEYNELNISIATLDSVIKNEGENIEKFEKQKADFVAKLAELEGSLPGLNKEMEDFTTQATRATLTEEERVVLDGVVADIRETEESKKELSAKQKELEAERTKGYNEMDALSESISSKERALQRLDDELENLRTRIEEEYGETYESCRGEKAEGYDMSQSSANITNLRRQQTMLGPVNIEAIKEYEEENKRHDEMLAQKEDLTKAIDDLTKALDDICQEMLRIFNEGFKKINENFGRTFKELFGGGSASLELLYEEGQDPLDAGVEINACPPGKKLSKISLLSGGEQALTAIAILFAIIQMRPMPFCFLDEIEAALDDANVGRYANYLKKFSEDTQFIVITHRKPTMEVADTLFGVTMEEKGVSKIVSVKLSEVETKLGGDTIQ
ncbi:MAG: chromosome segregation protein SMC [Clostridia bacterium]|nr:chromosome segregation protein SMC [Clostridia bacterium]